MRVNAPMSDFFSVILTHFMGRSFLAIVGVSSMTSVVGCFVLWRRLTFFGDALSHAAILGVVLGLAFHMDYTLSVVLLSIGMGFIISHLCQSKRLPSDVYLSLFSYSSLSLGLVILSLFPRLRVDPTSLLFGDILAIGRSDLIWIWAALAVVLTLSALGWRWLLVLMVDEDMARLCGIPVKLLDACLLGGIALTIAIAIKAVGALLVPALLIFPAAIMRPYSHTPEQMVFGAFLVSIFTSTGGLLLSFWVNAPSGPLIVLTYLGVFCLSHIKLTLFNPSPNTPI